MSLDDRQPPAKTGVSRRFFLGAGSVTAAALAAPAAALARNTADADGERETLVAQAPLPGGAIAYRYEAFSEPHVIASSHGEVNTDLTVDEANFTYQCGATPITIRGRRYSTYLPGPTFLVDPGDKIKITLNNNLPEADPSCPGQGLNTPYCFDTTNMHFHGLHVSPSSYCVDGKNVLSSDDVLLEIEPGQRHNWCVWLPKFHAPGTHWYHAHKHGSTGLQVSNGMAGAIIIREPVENQIVNPSEDKVWVIQEIVPPPAGTNCDPDTKTCDDAVYKSGGKGSGGVQYNKTAGDFLVNGRCQPTLEIQAGKLQRWRFINATATPRGLMSLQLCKASGPNDTSTDCTNAVDMYLMAVDGISFYDKPPEAIGPSNTRTPKWENWQLAPGNRADFLIKLDAADRSTPQWYKLIKEANPGAGGSTQSSILAYIEVQPSTYDDEIPQKIPGSLSNFPYLTPIGKSDLENVDESGTIQPKSFNFSRTAGTPSTRKFLINGKQYDPTRIDADVMLGTAEEWALSHSGGSSHPFHIHVNPFQIVGDKIDPNGEDVPENWRWWDTIALYSNTNNPPPLVQPVGQATTTNPIRIRQWFSDYPGEFVLHCHVLIHEDEGMMMNVRVKDNGTGTKPCYSLDSNGNSQPGTEIPGGATVCQGDPASHKGAKASPSSPKPPTIAPQSPSAS